MSKEFKSVDEAWEIMLASLYSPDSESLPLPLCLGKVLAEAIINDRDLPPFDRVMMDGFAIRSEDYSAGMREFRVTRVVAAGTAPGEPPQPGEAIEIMTGAVLPPGAGMVVRYEDCESDGARVKVKAENLAAGCNIHPKGTDKPEGAALVAAGSVLWAPELAIAATVGKISLQVWRNPGIAIICTGDELVPIDRIPESWQIRRSNDTAIAALLNSFNFPSQAAYIPDDEKKLSEYLQDENGKEVMVFIGGVSAGKFDLLPGVLRKEGFEILIHGIAQKPGKPFLFARKDDRFVFGLPGNPVSAMACAARYLLPWLRVSIGCQTGKLSVLVEPVPKVKPGFTHFVEARYFVDGNGMLRAEPDKGNGSGDLTHLHCVDGFVEISDKDGSDKALCSFWKIKP